VGRLEALEQSKDICVHRAQNSDVEELMRAAPDIEAPRGQTLGNAELRCSSILGLGGLKPHGGHAVSLQHTPYKSTPVP
jgi:hypothetical protein